MKIGIITQPLAVNYGGLLQNYALQQTLIRLGHEVYTINRSNTPIVYSSRWNKAYFNVKQLIKRFLNKPSCLLSGEYFGIRRNCLKFVRKNILTTEEFYTQKKLGNIICKNGFDGYIVGSDQVWRPCYSLNIYNDFLDFCQDKKEIKRVAYAASFGVSGWDFNEEQTIECGRLVKLFDAVSVREDSGVTLCEKHLGISAIHVLDPTLLLEKENYIKLVEANCEQESEGNFFCYILDSNEFIESAISDVERITSLKAFQVKSSKSDYAYKKGEAIKDYIIPSPTKWLRAFMDAKMIFTDSFHGCVFSIIFNKPFWVIGNKERGNARFDSLLKIFDIEDRRITISDINNIDLATPIDWDKVNKRKKEWQEKSMRFLKENL